MATDGNVASEGYLYRDWIPAESDEDAQKVHSSVRDANVGRPHQGPQDFVPAEGTEDTEDRSFEDKMMLARDAAIASEALYEERAREEFRNKLDNANEGQAIEFLRNLSPADRRIALTVERDGRAREAIFAAFGRAEDDQKAQEKGENEGKFGAARSDAPTESREVSDFPMDSASPSDRIHRGVARIRKAEGDESREIKAEEGQAPFLTEHESDSLMASAAHGYENREGLTEDAQDGGEKAEDVHKGMPAVNEEKARTIATKLASQDDESKTGADVMSEEDEKKIVEENTSSDETPTTQEDESADKQASSADTNEADQKEADESEQKNLDPDSKGPADEGGQAESPQETSQGDEPKKEDTKATKKTAAKKKAAKKADKKDGDE